MDQAIDSDGEIDVPDEAEEKRPVRRRSIGVGGKLYMALSGITLITIAAAVISIFAFTTLQKTLDQFTGTSIPAIKDSMALANASSNIAATAPALVSAATQEERDAIQADMQGGIEQLRARLDQMAFIDDAARTSLSGLIGEIESSLTELQAQISLRNELRIALDTTSANLRKEQRLFVSGALPLVRQASDTLQQRGQTAIVTSGDAVENLLSQEMIQLEAGLRTAAQGYEMLSVIALSATAETDAEVDAIERHFKETAGQINDAVNMLDDSDAAYDLRQIGLKLIFFGKGSKSVFDLRKAELAGEDANGQRRDRIDAEVAKVTEAFKGSIDPVINEATARLNAGGAGLVENIKDSISKLIHEDVGTIRDALELVAEANRIAGLLNAAAGAPDTAAVGQISSEFVLSNNGLVNALNHFRDRLDPLTLESGDLLIAFGTGDNSIFAIRGKYLEAEAASQAALAQSRAAVTTMSEEVGRLVALAETEAAASEKSARLVVTQSRYFMFAVCGVSVVLSLLIGWLLVSRQVVQRITGLAETMGVIADGDLQTEVDTSGADEISTMARTVEVFRENGLEVERLREEQRRAEARSAEERRTAMLNLADTFEKSVKAIVDQVGRSAEDMERSSETMVNASEQVKSESTGVRSIAEATSTNVNTMAAAAEELAASVQEISVNISETTRVAQQAADKAQTTDRIVASLDEESQKIGEVVGLITDIAEQTNLLALNATIEAARAGDAGKGFAVVASEVKNLATQTAKATEEISNQINAVQANTTQAVDAIREIGTLIGDMTEKMVAVSSAVEEQGASTDEIARSSSEAAQSTNQVSSTMEGMMGVAGEAGTTADQVLSAAKGVATQAQSLNREVETFLNKVRSGT
ncbi:methyl-accepting chemotaxis protein [Nisaea acidiphila]|uniref:Methyl-accepting chemotaxis protein n=1 Tax=Nisaea acidiphila TaxID=1862145 RepID=A0A9J7AX72_9PROT|nr:methyl-accepting chemotaxis protein [Nisaea acidiphila]UUX51975.1 methyl-accepting chemotaxis protein [Nisaea acidiphila]